MNNANHVAALEEVNRDIAALETELATLRTVQSYHAGKVGAAVKRVRQAVVAHDNSKNGTAQAAGPEFANMKLRDVAVAIMQRTVGPVSARQIADTMLAGGYQTKNPKGLRNTVFSMLDREEDLFEKADKGEWILKKSH